MQIVLWINNEPNQVALANKIHAHFPLAGIVAESRPVRRKVTIRLLAEKVIEKLLLAQIAKAWFGMLEFYRKKYNKLPDCKVLKVPAINSREVYDFTGDCNPDLIVVSGTSLIRKELLSLKPRIGIINLHTGLSPYIKGGPNCTNWCLATDQLQYIGNTIMWIDEGIDTGNIITTERTVITGEETLLDLHIKVMEHAHDLYIRAIRYLADLSTTPVSVKQSSIVPGKTFYTKQWDLRNKLKLVFNFRNLRKRIHSEEYRQKAAEVIVVQLPFSGGTS